MSDQLPPEVVAMRPPFTRRLKFILFSILAVISFIRFVVAKSKTASELGTPCYSGNDCASGSCLLVGAQGQCSKKCRYASDCGASYGCVEVEGSRFCQRIRSPGEPCADSSECSSQFCVTSPQTRPFDLGTCAQVCSATAGCPSGHHCARSEGGKDVCFPRKTRGSHCEADDECLSGSCFHPYSVGEQEAEAATPGADAVLDQLMSVRICR